MNFIQSSMLTFITRATYYASTLFISIYIARILGPQAKGVYSLLINFSLILAMIGLMGLNSSVLYFIGSKKYKPQDVYLNSFICVLAFMVILSAILFCFMRNVQDSLLKGVPTSYILLAICFFPFLLLSRLLGGIFLGLHKVHIYNLEDLIFSFLSVLFFVMFVIVLHQNVHGALWAYFFAALVSYLFYQVLLTKEFRFHFNIDWRIIQDLIGYGVKTSLGQVFLLLNYRITYYFINYFTNSAMVGVYSVALSFVEFILFVPESIGTVLFPKLSASNLERAISLTCQVSRTLFFMSVCCAIIYYLIGKWIILFIFGQQYLSSITPMKIILPGIVVLSLHHAFFRFFSSIDKPELTAKILFVTLFVNTMLNILLIPLLNINGAAYASTISSLFCIGLSLFLFRRFARVPIANILFIRIQDLNKILKDLRLKKLYIFNPNND